MKPITKYAKSGDINIAYQVVGQGPVDLIYVPGWISNIDMMWVDDRISKFLIKLTAFSRLILFDKRDLKKHFKTTPSKWLKTRRMEYAKTLLMKSELNVNQICFECGFVNNSHFILTFKNAYKLTPKQFKKTYRKS